MQVTVYGLRLRVKHPWKRSVSFSMWSVVSFLWYPPSARKLVHLQGFGCIARDFGHVSGWSIWTHRGTFYGRISRVQAATASDMLSVGRLSLA